MHVFVARSTIALAIVYQLMIRFVFIILLSFTNNHPRELLCPNSLSGVVVYTALVSTSLLVDR